MVSIPYRDPIRTPQPRLVFEHIFFTPLHSICFQTPPVFGYVFPSFTEAVVAMPLHGAAKTLQDARDGLVPIPKDKVYV